MRCPKCGYNSFEHNLRCPKCREDLASTRALLHLNLPKAGAANFFESAETGRDQPALFLEEASTPPETERQAVNPPDAGEEPGRPQGFDQGLDAGGRDDSEAFGELLQSALDGTESESPLPPETRADDFSGVSEAEPKTVAVEVMGTEFDRPPLARPYQKLVTTPPGHRELIGKLAQALKETGDVKDRK